MRLCRAIGIITDPPHLKRTMLISLLVGSWLSFFNLGDVMAHGDMSVKVWLKVALDYATPFVVANLGLLSHSR